jgi:hypothetical protein
MHVEEPIQVGQHSVPIPGHDESLASRDESLNDAVDFV